MYMCVCVRVCVMSGKNGFLNDNLSSYTKILTRRISDLLRLWQVIYIRRLIEVQNHWTIYGYVFMIGTWSDTQSDGRDVRLLGCKVDDMIAHVARE